MVLKFRKKPIVIEAVQWFRQGDHPIVTSGANANWSNLECTQCGRQTVEHGFCPTLEGVHIVCPGDWIIKGIKGEFYPCKPDIFRATYERVYEGEPGD
jgi:hypothetical protein